MLQRIRRQQRTKKTHSHRTPRHRSPITEKNHRKIPEKPGRQMEKTQRTSDARMTVAETSLQAYYKKQKTGTLTEDQEQVYQIIKKHGPISCKQTARRMNKFPNEISGRFTELRKQKNLIKISGVKNGHRQYKAKNQ